MRRRKALGGVPRGYIAPLPSVRQAREDHREDGRLDAMDVAYGEEARREPFATLKDARNRRKGGDERYTQGLLDADWAGYREGYEKYMRGHGSEALVCRCLMWEGQDDTCPLHGTGAA